MNIPNPTPAPITNALTVDVEDYFQVSALAPFIARDRWDSIPCRVEANVDRLLNRFADNHAKATFFTLGWIAERYPQVVRRIVADGHELASHGYGHQRASELSREAFAQDVTRAKRILEDIAGVPVIGYRAPSFSIGTDNLWAFDVLKEAGYVYSSSVYPVQHDHYGMPDAPRFPYQVRDGLTELPITTVRALGRNLPAGGGGYFRFAPYSVSRWAIDRFNRDERAPAIFYMHPWEIDPLQPRVPGPGLKTRFRHYVNLHRTEGRLERLLGDFRWGRMDQVFNIAR
ncbi:XrtA system polysaccharide deacetylase [Rhizobacter sp. SG703]|uniref:XrtA system polysaccharide deacetylase n=1 Tax=Rhizobacter sp. SG703 TaxID=2587140 RepID=UPI00144733B7|nr:XrtA system polysaccharide deacetylase [Rhizobacter sp. SG703]NKI95553.1 polysaccharide deacetylase family protein (PEP-CTERM system associated) [Rhizobacter sp. SG703]